MLSHSVMSDSLWPPWTVAHQAPLSMGFSRQEYWSGLPFPPPGGPPDQTHISWPLALTGSFFTISATWRNRNISILFFWVLKSIVHFLCKKRRDVWGVCSIQSLLYRHFGLSCNFQGCKMHVASMQCVTQPSILSPNGAAASYPARACSFLEQKQMVAVMVIFDQSLPWVIFLVPCFNKERLLFSVARAGFHSISTKVFKRQIVTW